MCLKLLLCALLVDFVALWETNEKQNMYIKMCEMSKKPINQQKRIHF